ncbi:MAG: hypothetical protein B7Z73_06700 [Planctomycetia bacterium 21-64-5]|nr:MAG: hypothetical protein B7Z73_06700 [Planctomycetia bacterium 21-64-5]HQU43995.1 hypothetical protein [Pirellulales bacterium]
MLLTRGRVLLLLAYLATMGVVVAALVAARRRVIASLDTPQAREQWRAWKAETARQKQSGEAVARRAVTSDEPPALILLRDRFPAIVVSTVLICSFLFAFLAFVVRGVLGPGRPTP